MIHQTMTNDVVIRLERVSKTYALYDRNVVDRFKDTFLPGRKKRYREFPALKDVSLEVKRGEILGIVGRNGAGKSTLLKIVSGITQPTSGTVATHGRIVPLLELGGGFNPEYTGRENVYFYCSLQGMRKQEIDAVYGEIVEFAELGEFIDVPVKKYSSGMRARLAFSVSINIDPDILILDEVLSVGDELFRRKCMAKMEEFFSGGKTILFVSHAAQSVVDICTRAVLLHLGENLFDGDPRAVIHRYSLLLAANPVESGQVVERIKKNNESAQKKYPQPHSRIANNEIPPQAAMMTSGMSYLDPELVSKSRREVCAVSGIAITDDALVNQSGLEVNHVFPGEKLQILATVSFDVPCKQISVGAVIYTIDGKNQTGIVMPKRAQCIQSIFAGDELRIGYRFVAYLVPGVYFIRFLVHGITQDRVDQLFAVQDALVFRVMHRAVQYDAVTSVDLFDVERSFIQKQGAGGTS